MNKKFTLLILAGALYVMEDISGADVDKYRYEINFLPEWGIKPTFKN